MGQAQVWVAEENGVLESPLADHPLRVDGEPAPLPEIQDILVVQVVFRRASLTPIEG